MRLMVIENMLLWGSRRTFSSPLSKGNRSSCWFLPGVASHFTSDTLSSPFLFSTTSSITQPSPLYKLSLPQMGLSVRTICRARTGVSRGGLGAETGDWTPLWLLLFSKDEKESLAHPQSIELLWSLFTALTPGFPFVLSSFRAGQFILFTPVSHFQLLIEAIRYLQSEIFNSKIWCFFIAAPLQQIEIF